jgi:H+/Cl- antiporter ClcA
MQNRIKRKKLSRSKYIAIYVTAIIRWIFLALVVGTVCGLVGALFYTGVAKVTLIRGAHKWLIFLLPPAGLLIALIYEKLDVAGSGTDTVIDSVLENRRMDIKLVPAIFIGTILTHLGGGSAGKEGAAMQIGGGIGSNIGKIGGFRGEELKIATMTGMAAFFSAVFGTPLTAAAFVVMFIKVGHVPQSAVLPCFVSAHIAIWISEGFGVEPFRFKLAPIEPPPFFVIRVMILAILCGLLAALMCEVFHGTARLYKKIFPNKYIRIFIGGCLVIALTMVEGSGSYNGAGNPVISEAIEEGRVVPLAFLLKLIFTALTLGAGYKGGEIVPTFFIGASFGCLVGSLLGIPPGFAAAVGMVTVFGGATNTIMAPIFLAVESFGGPHISAFALACVISYVCSGYTGLYSSQNIIYSKVRVGRVNIKANKNDMVRNRNPKAAFRLMRMKYKKTLGSDLNRQDDKRPKS